MDKSAFIYSEDFLGYDFGDTHPLRPLRLKLTYELVSAYGLLDKENAKLFKPDPAEENEILRIHSKEYLEAVKKLSRKDYSDINPARFHLGYGDNPVFAGMYEASCLYTGASILAQELVFSGEFSAAFNISGGLHHAGKDFAHGFCIFNDPAIIIHRLMEKGLKIAYIDIDAHHGDGVQNAFYDTRQVLTISIHESGRFLFPGTGETHEEGAGEGEGYSVNIPLAPYTDDETYLWAFREIVPPLIDAFTPDIVVSQLGVDTHYLDPLAHLNLTVFGYGEVIKLIKGMSKGRWIALGGGGYNLKVVPRAWCLAYGLMLGEELPAEIPGGFSQRYNIERLSDEEKPTLSQDQRTFVEKFAQKTVEEIKRNIFPKHKT